MALPFIAPSEANASDPAIQWRQIETEHFVVVFDSRHYELAQQYAGFAEQAFQAVSPAFGIWPEKTAILLNDSSDLANGFATSLPYPLINAYPVLPEPLDPISDYGNWGLELLTHEYTHILTFEPATGIARPFRWVFGSIVRPNLLLPRWYLEGLAVYMETRYSSFGRLRSANFLAIPRAMVNAGTLRTEDIARVNETTIPDFPGGNRPYLMGSLLWDEMVRDNPSGEALIGDLNLAYSRRVPFFINQPVIDRLGFGYQQLLDRVYDRVEKMVSAQIAAINAVGATPFKNLTRSEERETRLPTVSPDGNFLASIIRRSNGVEYLDVQTRATQSGSNNEFKAGFRKGTDGVNRIAWLKDSQSLIFDQILPVHHFNDYSDLWRADLNLRDHTMKTVQLTHGLRAHDPAISLDGKYIVFVRNLPGATVLAMSLLDGSQVTTLYTPPPQTRISYPEFLSSDRLIFSERQGDGVETLKVASINLIDTRIKLNGKPQEILTAFAPARFPHRTTAGLLFTSDRSGVSNIYLSEDLKTARALTNVKTRAATADIDAKSHELLFSQLDANGWNNVSVANHDWQRVVVPPQVEPLIDHPWPRYNSVAEKTAPKDEEYRPGQYLIPRYWMPYIYSGPNGLYYQASTDASDPTGRHAYGLTASYDPLARRPSLFGSYANHTTPITYTLIGEDLNEYLFGFDLVRQTTSATIDGSFFLLPDSEKWRGGLAWQYFKTDTPDFGDAGNTIRSGVRATVSWSDVTQHGLEISPERGSAFSFSQSKYLPSWGNIEYEQSDFSGSYYFSHWLPERHALAFFVNASVAPRLPSGLDLLLLGQTTVGGNYQSGILHPGFLVRGYASGIFIGRNMISGTAEYRFPISYRYRGLGTSPIFLSRVHGDLFTDVVTLDGAWYDGVDKLYVQAKLGNGFVGYGGELKFDATIFYQIPAQFIVGLYQGANNLANPNGLFPFIGFGL